MKIYRFCLDLLIMLEEMERRNTIKCNLDKKQKWDSSLLLMSPRKFNLLFLSRAKKSNHLFIKEKER